jgi:glycosyltransferase involved in cell wall biosynthesis
MSVIASEEAEAAVSQAGEEHHGPLAHNHETLAVIVSYNSAHLIRGTLDRVPRERDFDVLILDDHSTDDSWELIKATGLPAIRHHRNLGLGGNIKSGIRYALAQGYRYFVILAGNNKDDPREITRLIAALRAGFHYVQGSRFAPGGVHKHTPPARLVGVRLHAAIFNLLTGYRFPFTDAINGFRAYDLSIFGNDGVDVWRDWLDGYEFETYLQAMVLRRGYRVTEAPVSKTYPVEKGVRYTHIRPFVDYIHILKPALYLLLGLRK